MIGYLANEKFLPELLEELKNVRSVHGSLVLTEGPLQNPVWAQNIWQNAEILPFESISQAAKALKGLGKLWSSYSIDNHRRAQLIQDQLPKLRPRIVDFGSCPGGWTWVLQQMGCEVVSIDRAPLEPHIAKLPHIHFMKTNAFTVKPQDIGAIDWFFSDIICYPEKLYELVCDWQSSGLCSNFVCTIKFQGRTDFDTLKKFQALENTYIKHLHHNKHEVTVWITRSSP